MIGSKSQLSELPSSYPIAAFQLLYQIDLSNDHLIVAIAEQQHAAQPRATQK